MTISVDPFYESILRELSGHLDPEVFQSCSAALLRTVFPSLISLVGGTDQGADGLYSDSGSILPLVCTVGSDVIGNVTQNLSEYIRNHPPVARGLVLVATSQDLTPRRISNIRVRVRALGFADAQVYGRSALAALLYESPQWCERLLGLTGEPPALSSRPRTTRILTKLPLRGRDDDLNWLQSTAADCILVGQPGSGKTAILSLLCETASALFVRTKDPTALSRELRSKKPAILILDDAHSGGCLTPGELADIRSTIGAHFRIVVGTWPSAASVLGRSIRAEGVLTRELAPLTRDEVVSVLRDYGLASPTGLIRLIVDQSRGRPGLAVTLANVAFAGGIDDLVSGRAITSDLVLPLQGRHRVNTRAIVGVLGVGGRSGMAIAQVSKALGYSDADVLEACTELAAAGIVSEVDDSRISVWPDALRHSLVREVFFHGPYSLPAATLDLLVAAAHSRHATLRELIGVLAIGCNAAEGFVESMLENGARPQEWCAYASLGQREATLALARCPERSTELERICLRVAPDETILPLLLAARGDDRALSSHPDHPLRMLQDWVEAGTPGRQAASRRESLMAAACVWHRKGYDEVVALRAISIALSPRYQSLESDPGSGHRITISTGVVSVDDVDAMIALWKFFVASVDERPFSSLQLLIGISSAWLHPGRLCPSGIPDAVRQRLTFGGTEMARDIERMSKSCPAVRERLRRQLGANAGIAESDDMTPYRLLFPWHGELFEKRELWKDESLSLATTWSQRGAARTAIELECILTRARAAGLYREETLASFAPLLAERCDAQEWVLVALDHNLPVEFVAPFLVRHVRDDQEAAIPTLQRLFALKQFENFAARLVLVLEAPPPDLWLQAETVLTSAAQQKSLWIQVANIPMHNWRRLLSAQDPSLKFSVLHSLWIAGLRGDLRDGLVDERRAALMSLANCPTSIGGHDSYYLTEMVSSDSDLAFDWLCAFAANEDSDLEFGDGHLAKIVAKLDKDRRRFVLARIGADSSREELLGLLIEDDVELYGELLADERRKSLHLLPLERAPDEIWIKFALLAGQAGYSAKTLANTAYGHSWEWTGDVSEMYDGRVTVFREMEHHSDPFIHEIARIGLAQASKAGDWYREKERRERVFGRD